MKTATAYFGIFAQTESGKYYLKTARNSEGLPFLTKQDAVECKKLHYPKCTVLPLNSPLLKD